MWSSSLPRATRSGQPAAIRRKRGTIMAVNPYPRHHQARRHRQRQGGLDHRAPAEAQGFAVRAAPAWCGSSASRPARSTPSTAGGPFYRRAGELHDQRPLPADGPRAGRRRGHAPHRHRRHRPRRGRPGHHPEALRRVQGHGTRSTPRTATRTPRGRSAFFFPREASLARPLRASPSTIGLVDLTQVVVPVTLSGYASGRHSGPRPRVRSRPTGGSPGDPLFEGLGLTLVEPVDGYRPLQATGDGRVSLAGPHPATVGTECRRCLTDGAPAGRGGRRRTLQQRPRRGRRSQRVCAGGRGHGRGRG